LGEDEVKTINNLHEFAIPKSVVWYFVLVVHTWFSMKAEGQLHEPT